MPNGANRLNKLDELALKLLSFQFEISRLDGYSKNSIFRDIESEVFFSYFKQKLESKKPIIYPVFLDRNVRESLTKKFQKLDITEIKSINRQIKEKIKEQFMELTELNIEDYVNLFHLIGTLRSYSEEALKPEILEIYKDNLEFLREEIYTKKNKGLIPGFVKLSIRQIMVDLKLKLEEGLERLIEQLEGRLRGLSKIYPEISAALDELKTGSYGGCEGNLEILKKRLGEGIMKSDIHELIDRAKTIIESINKAKDAINSINNDLDIGGEQGISTPINRFKIVYITFYYYPTCVTDSNNIRNLKTEIVEPYTNILDKICNG